MSDESWIEVCQKTYVVDGNDVVREHITVKKSLRDASQKKAGKNVGGASKACVSVQNARIKCEKPTAKHNSMTEGTTGKLKRQSTSVKEHKN